MQRYERLEIDDSFVNVEKVPPDNFIVEIIDTGKGYSIILCDGYHDEYVYLNKNGQTTVLEGEVGSNGTNFNTSVNRWDLYEEALRFFEQWFDKWNSQQ